MTHLSEWVPHQPQAGDPIQARIPGSVLYNAIGTAARGNWMEEAHEQGTVVTMGMDHPRIDQRRHILVVEDDLIIADLIDQILRFEHFDVSHVVDGQSAVNFVEETVPDLILMDLMLPVMSGIEASRIIKSNVRGEVAQIPIVAMSAGVNLRAAAGELPVDGVLAKPFDIDELLATVGIHVRAADERAANQA